MAKDQIEEAVNAQIIDDIPAQTGVNFVSLIMTKNNTETVYNNETAAKKAYLAISDIYRAEYETGCHVNHFRFKKAVTGTISKPSEFFSILSGGNASEFGIKFLNDDADITNWTRVFVDVYTWEKTFYIRVSGC